jgi:KDO2-lipid IV(A) lauroyltransferase
MLDPDGAPCGCPHEGTCGADLRAEGWDARVRRLKDWLIYLLVRIFICIVQAMRIETCQTVSRWLAILACDAARIRADDVDENLRRVYPGWSARRRGDAARRMWEHLFLMVCEVAHTPRKVHETNWRRYVHIRGKRDLVRFLVAPRPVLIVTGHFGNFEVGGYMMGMLGFPTYTIARPLDNPYLDRFVGEFRKARGQHILPKQGSAAQVNAVLQSGGL